MEVHDADESYNNTEEENNLDAVQEYGSIHSPHDSQHHRATTSRWDVMFTALKQFHSDFGTCNVPQIYPADPKLGLWVMEQRERYAKRMRGQSAAVTTTNFSGDYISDEEIAALGSLHFIWDGEELEWDIMYRDLLAFQKVYGHCQVPLWFPLNPKLGSWVFRQKRMYDSYRKGEPNTTTLSKFRIKLLQDADVLRV